MKLSYKKEKADSSCDRQNEKCSLDCFFFKFVIGGKQTERLRVSNQTLDHFGEGDRSFMDGDHKLN